VCGCTAQVIVKSWRLEYSTSTTLWCCACVAELTAHGLVQSDADPALWIMHGGGHVITIFYVDDGMVAARTAAEADAHVDLVAGMFSIHKLGEPQDILGIEISRDRDAGTITIRQASKAHSLATAFGVEGERCATPMTPVVYGELQAARECDDMADKEAYQSGIGSLLHMAQCMRPDIAAPVGALAAFFSAPTAAHYVAMLNVTRYVGCTSNRGITYGHTGVPMEMWFDAKFAACLDTRRSVSGWVVVCFGGAASWERCKQPTAAASTMDAEYQACGAAAREALSFPKFVREFVLLSSALRLEKGLHVFCDN
jgi:hypothetical protein